MDRQLSFSDFDQYHLENRPKDGMGLCDYPIVVDQNPYTELSWKNGLPKILSIKLITSISTPYLIAKLHEYQKCTAERG